MQIPVKNIEVNPKHHYISHFKRLSKDHKKHESHSTNPNWSCLAFHFSGKTDIFFVIKQVTKRKYRSS